MTRSQQRRIRIANNAMRRFAARRGADIAGDFHTRKYPKRARAALRAEVDRRFAELCAAF